MTDWESTTLHVTAGDIKAIEDAKERQLDEARRKRKGLLSILLIGFKLDNGRTHECSINLKRGFEKLGHVVNHVSPEEILKATGAGTHEKNLARAYKRPVPLSIVLDMFPGKYDLVFVVQSWMHFFNDKIYNAPVAYYHNEDYCQPSMLDHDIMFYCQPTFKEFYRSFYPWSFYNCDKHLSPPAVHPEDFLPAKEKDLKGITYITDNAVEENREKRDWLWNEIYTLKDRMHEPSYYDHFFGGVRGSRSPFEPRSNWQFGLKEYKDLLARAETIAFIPVEHVPYSRRLFEAAACNTNVQVTCWDRDYTAFLKLFGKVEFKDHPSGTMPWDQVTFEPAIENPGDLRQWVLKHHTYEHRCNDIIEKVKKHVQESRRVAGQEESSADPPDTGNTLGDDNKGELGI